MQNEYTAPVPPDNLLPHANRDTQRQAARLAQESFGAAFRLTLEGKPDKLPVVIDKLAAHLREWSGMSTVDGRAARMALLMAGLDQWGLAFSQTFDAGGMGGLSLLLGKLRDAMDVAEEAACQRFFDDINNDEACALDFKVELRREIHLALWHAMIASEDRDEAFGILEQLGAMMLALTRTMPTLGWRLLADALASVQIRCLQQGLALEGLGQETTQQLFGAVAQELPEDLRGLVMEQASQAVMAWQRARRENDDQQPQG
ncbi:hypothetical protein ACDA63_01605 [Uliginosibacterium sp. sgz301328]|uniref:hypothetical protein n=1 Tax=Uliginosibacterium sp. sgz301328 TaxID=3243764 RepID=UPI00359DF5CC